MELYRVNRTFLYNDFDGNEEIKTWIFEGQLFYVKHKTDLPGYGIHYNSYFDLITLDSLTEVCNTEVTS